MDGWVDGLGRCPGNNCRDAGKFLSRILLRHLSVHCLLTAGRHRIVEYATREQAQQAVAQLSNQNLMGRLVYVREVGESRW